jgi:GMP synthase-like glutamine amidotransferase
MKNAVAIRHVAFEDAGTLEGVLADRGLEAGVDDLSPARDADLVVVLGGPIGIYEVDRYPFLKQELATIETAVKKGVPAIGICLGCQALAAVLAACVYPGKQKELGWDEMTLTKEGKASPIGAIDGIRVLNWHGDTFDLPTGATRLASRSRQSGFHLRPQGARAAIPRGATPEAHGALADRPHARAHHVQGRSRQDARRHRALCPCRQCGEPASVQRLARWGCRFIRGRLILQRGLLLGLDWRRQRLARRGGQVLDLRALHDVALGIEPS